MINVADMVANSIADGTLDRDYQSIADMCRDNGISTYALHVMITAELGRVQPAAIHPAKTPGYVCRPATQPAAPTRPKRRVPETPLSPQPPVKKRSTLGRVVRITLFSLWGLLTAALIFIVIGLSLVYSEAYDTIITARQYSGRDLTTHLGSWQYPNVLSTGFKVYTFDASKGDVLQAGTALTSGTSSDRVTVWITPPGAMNGEQIQPLSDGDPTKVSFSYTVAHPGRHTLRITHREGTGSVEVNNIKVVRTDAQQIDSILNSFEY